MNETVHPDDDSIRLAHRLCRAGATSVGLLPAGPRVSVPALARRLALALAHVYRARVRYLSARRIASGRFTATLAHLLEDERHPYDFALVDLTGLDRTGEQPAACDLLDGVVVMCRAGAVSEEELLRTCAALPASGLLGVVLLS